MKSAIGGGRKHERVREEVVFRAQFASRRGASNGDSRILCVTARAMISIMRHSFDFNTVIDASTRIPFTRRDGPRKIRRDRGNDCITFAHACDPIRNESITLDDVCVISVLSAL